jgi:shikimate kinase
MNLILIGMRGTGKTSIGRRVAMRLRRRFFDTDQLVEEELGEPLSRYVDRRGWEPFREVEHRVICRVAQQRDAVISTGGGALTYARNVDALKPSGLVVLLAADPLTLSRRLQRSYARPPLTAERSLEAEMCSLWRQREPLYRGVCDVVLDVAPETDDEEADLQAKVSSFIALVQPYLVHEVDHASCGRGPCNAP